MKKLLIIPIIILWAIGIQKMNSVESGYIAPKIKNPTEVTKVATTSLLVSTSTPKITKKVATTTPKKKELAPVVKAPVVEPIVPETPPDFETINTNARKAIVNVYCTAKNNELYPISGTGVVISSDGIVLTNAHVAQYFLLKDLYMSDYIQCVLRTGSPAYPQYKVELAYMPIQWVKDNKSMLNNSNPTGTGENDFALLRITGTVDNQTIPNLSFLSPNTSEYLQIDEPVLLVSYPAGFLGGLLIIRDLNLTSGITAIRDYFTFTQNKIDVISVPGTIVSQKGSSGGAVVDKNQKLIGIITTSSTANTTGERNLNAITMAYVNRTLKNNIGMDLAEFLSSNTANFAKNFQANEAPNLTQILTDELNKNK